MKTDSSRHTRIFLWGPMGSGKSFIGKQLAEALSLPFIDLDLYLEAREYQRISAIFATQGEASFREKERASLLDVLDRERAFVLATGGGTPCFFDNAERMNQAGLTVYLKYPLSVLWDRLKGEIDARPLLQGGSEVDARARLERLLADRATCYEQAHLVYAPADPHADAARELATYFQQIIGH